MMNDFVNSKWKAKPFCKYDQIWSTLKSEILKLKMQFHRIMVVGGGSAEFWGLEQPYDTARHFMRHLLASLGIVVIDGLALLLHCERCYDGFHLDGSDTSNQPNAVEIGMFSKQCFEYLSMTTSTSGDGRLELNVEPLFVRSFPLVWTSLDS